MHTIQTHNDPSTSPLLARRVILRGHLQGLGVRPCISRLAEKLRLAGSVLNTTKGVEILVEGTAENVAEFERQLPEALPKDSVIDSYQGEAAIPSVEPAFKIINNADKGGLSAPIPTDRAICSACLEEMRDKNNRRYRYPFISCTLCGPRYSIIRQMPYEREDTTMAEFTLCPLCQQEYDSTSDRRYHAQTNACPKCGPQVWSSICAKGQEDQRGEEAIQQAVESLVNGKIVAIKGLGGYQLLADATNVNAVNQLRQRKGRPAKPLAVLVGSLAEAHQLTYINDREEAALVSPANPIVLLQAKQPTLLCSSVNPDLAWVGLMLPTTPLHAILADGCQVPLVCTSGNHDGDPLVYTVKDANRELGDICHLWLHHNREIQNPVDDSVVRIISDRIVTLRLARGLAPLKLDLRIEQPMHALGGHLKCATAWSNGYQSVLGPHLGDLDELTTRQRLHDQISTCQRLYRFVPKITINDSHPDYYTTRLAKDSSAPTRSIQHHHAHVVAGMLENNWLDRTVLGISWDGTGYGSDDTIWGGEFLVCDRKSYRRVAHLRPFSLPGGERAVLQPWRTAVSILADSLGENCASTFCFKNVSSSNVNSVLRMRKKPHLSAITTSVGRLFDTAANIILGVTEVSFEGQAAMMLESVANPKATGSYSIQLTHGDLDELDWRPMFSELIYDQQRGKAASAMAMRFHRGLAHGIVSICRHWQQLPIVLVGGVFQNKLLTELVVELLSGNAQPLGLAGKIPPNDGGLAAGQLATEWAE